ncbi:hypothetical protein HPP92_027573 [Vanilla planifolia]|uniref:Uncharacterized protein n=1 Tax=Vanilla planifolia TaxID=51239 RepID=A0A835PBB7_VANPL|nr:hypothetical protein HPP92_027573 [Vanilla planifolia]
MLGCLHPCFNASRTCDVGQGYARLYVRGNRNEKRKDLSFFGQSFGRASGQNLLLETIGPATEDLKKKGINFSLWFKPESYVTDI